MPNNHEVIDIDYVEKEAKTLSTEILKNYVFEFLSSEISKIPNNQDFPTIKCIEDFIIKKYDMKELIQYFLLNDDGELLDTKIDSLKAIINIARLTKQPNNPTQTARNNSSMTLRIKEYKNMIKEYKKELDTLETELKDYRFVLHTRFSKSEIKDFKLREIQKIKDKILDKYVAKLFGCNHEKLNIRINNYLIDNIIQSRKYSHTQTKPTIKLKSW